MNNLSSIPAPIESSMGIKRMLNLQGSSRLLLLSAFSCFFLIGQLLSTCFHGAATAPVTSLYVFFCLLVLGAFRLQGLSFAALISTGYFYFFVKASDFTLTDGISFLSSLSVWYFIHLTLEEGRGWINAYDKKIDELQKLLSLEIEKYTSLNQEKIHIQDQLSLQVENLKNDLMNKEAILAEKLGHLTWLQQEIDLLNAQKQEILLSAYHADEAKIADFLDLDARREELRVFELQKGEIATKLALLENLETQCSQLKEEVAKKVNLEGSIQVLEQELEFLKEENKSIFSLKEKIATILEEKAHVEEELKAIQTLPQTHNEEFASKILSLEGLLTEKSLDCERLNNELCALKSTIQDKEIKITDLESLVLKKDEAVQALEEKIQLDTQEFNNQVNLLNIQLLDHETRGKALNLKIETLNLQKETFDIEIEKLKNQLIEASEQKANLENLSHLLKSQQLEYEAVSLKFRELQVELESTVQEKQNFERELLSLGSNKESLSCLCLQLQDALAQYRQIESELEKGLQDQQLICQNQQDTISKLKLDLASKETDNFVAHEQLLEANRLILDFEHKIRWLEDQLAVYSSNLLAQEALQKNLAEKTVQQEQEFSELMIKFTSLGSNLEKKELELSKMVEATQSLNTALIDACTQNQNELEVKALLEQNVTSLSKALDAQKLAFDHINRQLEQERSENQNLIQRIEALNLEASNVPANGETLYELAKVKGLYSQLKNQFKEKSLVLDSTRQTVFKLEGELEALKISARENELTYTELLTYEGLIKKLVSMQQELDSQSAEIEELQTFISALLQEV